MPCSPGAIYEIKALTLLWHFNFCRISFPWAQETGTAKIVKLSTCWLKADTKVEFHGGCVDSRWETPVKSEWAYSVKAEITDHKPLPFGESALSLWTKMLRKQLILFLRELACRPRECFTLYSVYSERDIAKHCHQLPSYQFCRLAVTPHSANGTNRDWNECCRPSYTNKSTSKRWGLQCGVQLLQMK